MEINDIPQDNSKIFQGQKKVVYATQDGQYKTATTTGWEAEEFATEQAVEVLNQQAEEALQAVKSGEKSVLYYLMYKYRFDEVSLSQATGIWKWQLRRHFKPQVFARLPEKVLTKYAEVFGLTINQLKERKNE